jgi:spore maturation protein CgeB
MHIVLFYHSIVSDWNHGNAHFLRGIVTELMARGHRVEIYEPRNGWSMQNLRQEHGDAPVTAFRQAFPHLLSQEYDLETLDLDQVLERADLVLAHEWNDKELIKRLARHRRRHSHYRLLFHDTHHRALSDSRGIGAHPLQEYDGVLAFGRVVRERYLQQGWARRAWIWHEAADITRFHPLPGVEQVGDLVWVGNWGDDERSEQLREFLFEPVQQLQLKSEIYGVRYPARALDALAAAGIAYKGWLPNYQVPEVFARFRLTVHIPRQPYVQALPGIPTIRVFEALACGIPLVSAPWDDVEGLFTPGQDYLIAHDGAEMTRLLAELLNDPDAAHALGAQGRQTVMARHTCGHRVDELLSICQELALDTTPTIVPALVASEHPNSPASLYSSPLR